MKYYTITAMIEGEAYSYMAQADFIHQAVEKFELEVNKSWCENEGVEIDIDEMPAMHIVSVVVTTTKPERYGEYYV